MILLDMDQMSIQILYLQLLFKKKKNQFLSLVYSILTTYVSILISKIIWDDLSAIQIVGLLAF